MSTSRAWGDILVLLFSAVLVMRLRNHPLSCQRWGVPREAGARLWSPSALPLLPSPVPVASWPSFLPGLHRCLSSQLSAGQGGSLGPASWTKHLLAPSSDMFRRPQGLWSLSQHDEGMTGTSRTRPQVSCTEVLLPKEDKNNKLQSPRAIRA